MHSDLRELTAKAFNEVLAKLLPGYEPNEYQKDYADHVSRGLLKQTTAASVFMLEAETGTGKTLGYLIPLAIHCALTGERAIVSTQTNNLSRQILTKDGQTAIQVAKALTGHTITIGRRVGLRNYVDYDRIRAIMKDVNDETAELLGCWIKAAPDTFIEAAEKDMKLPAGMAEADICLTAGSTDQAKARYLSDVEDGKYADILITNHALTLIHLRAKMPILDGTGRAATIAIFDEADTVPDVARLMADRKLPLSTLDALAGALGNGKSRDGLVDACKRFRTEVGSFLGDSNRGTVSGGENDCGAVLKAGSILLHALKQAATATRQADLKLGLRDASASVQEWISAAKEEGWMLSAKLTASPIRKFPSLTVSSARPALMLRKMWKDGDDGPLFRAVMLTSATLSIGDRDKKQPAASVFRHMVNAVGAREVLDADLCAQFAPDKFGWMNIVLADPSVPPPTKKLDEERSVSDPAWLAYAAAGIREAHRRGGRVFALTTSYGDAAALGQMLPGAIVHNSGQKLSLMQDQFVAAKDSILITPTGWAGVDLPGMIDNLVVARVPYASPDPARDDDWVYQEGIFNALRRLRQGIGRLIRGVNDGGTLWILDPRFPRPNDAKKGPGPGLHTCIPIRFRRSAIGRSAYEKAGIFVHERLENAA